MPTVRAADQAGDRAGIARIDTSFQTDRIYRVPAGPAGFRLIEEPADPLKTKTGSGCCRVWLRWRWCWPGPATPRWG